MAALSDDIAYNNHDIDDGLRAELFAAADLHDLPVVGEIFKGVEARYPGLAPAQLALSTSVPVTRSLRHPAAANPA